MMDRTEAALEILDLLAEGNVSAALQRFAAAGDDLTHPDLVEALLVLADHPEVTRSSKLAGRTLPLLRRAAALLGEGAGAADLLGRASWLVYRHDDVQMAFEIAAGALRLDPGSAYAYDTIRSALEDGHIVTVEILEELDGEAPCRPASAAAAHIIRTIAAECMRG
jgi:hypothetical protein